VKSEEPIYKEDEEEEGVREGLIQVRIGRWWFW